MKFSLTAISCVAFFILKAQTKADSLQLIQNTVKLYDLDFTDAEADSMIGNLNNYLLVV